MEYLSNPFCKLEPMFETSKKKVNIISCVFFKMRKHYKNFKKYVSGLQRLIIFREKFLPNFKLRIFIDQTIVDDIEVMKILNKDKVNIQPVKYTCENYQEDNKYYHKGTFGTLVRFLPMFDFDNNDAKHVIIADIELNDDDMRATKDIYENYVNSDNKKKITFLYNGNIYKIFNIDNVFYPHVYAGRLFNFKRIDKNIIISFIENIYNIPSENQTCGYSKNQDNDDEIKYGIDECFLNKYLMKHFIESGTIFSYFVKYEIQAYFYFNIKEIINKKNKKYIKKIMGKYYDNRKTMEKNIGIFDEFFYGKREKISPEMELLSKNYINLIIEHNEKKNYDFFSKFIIETTLKYYKNTIYDESIFYIMPNKKIKKITLYSLLLENNNEIRGGNSNFYNSDDYMIWWNSFCSSGMCLKK